MYRALRFQAESHARVVLTKEARRMQLTGETDKAYPGQIFRTVDCMSKRHGYFVKLKHHAEFGSASYSGLVTCGSVWACPLCAAKIQERRRGEIEQALSWHAEVNSGAALMVTFTFPHVRFDSLHDLLTKQAEAFKLLRKGRRWDEMKESLGFLGLVRSLEVTHGLNGWHPHTHELWLVGSDVQTSMLRARLVELWKGVCLRVGLLEAGDNHDAFERHSVDVRGQVSSGDYLAKQDDSRVWGLADEIAKATSKAGRAKGVHPHHFLIRQEPGDDARYIEYVNGMKGKRQLFWSPGLKAKVGIEEVTDEELAEREEAGAQLLAAIPAPAWRYVVGNDARCELLDAAEAGGFDAVVQLLRSLGVPEGHLPLTPTEFRDSLEYLCEA